MLLLLMGKYFDLLSLGDEEARALGIDVGRIRMTAIILATLASSDRKSVV